MKTLKGIKNKGFDLSIKGIESIKGGTPLSIDTNVIAPPPKDSEGNYPPSATGNGPKA